MTAATVLPLILVIAALGTAAIVVGNAELDAFTDRWHDDRATRRAIEAERRKAAALKSPRCLP